MLDHGVEIRKQLAFEKAKEQESKPQVMNLIEGFEPINLFVAFYTKQ
jgi:hypothetical protein